MSVTEETPSMYPIGFWSPDIVTMVHDEATYRSVHAPGKVLLIPEVPVIGARLERVMVHDLTTHAHARLDILDAEVSFVELSHDRTACRLGLRGSPRQWMLRLVTAVVYPVSRRICGYNIAKIAERPHWTESYDAIPNAWKAIWSVHKGGNWDVGREDGWCAFVPKDRKVHIAFGTWSGKAIYMGALTEAELAEVIAWSETETLLLPPIAALSGHQEPALDTEGKARLIQGLRDSLRLLAY